MGFKCDPGEKQYFSLTNCLHYYAKNLKQPQKKLTLYCLSGRMAGCLHLVMARGVSWVTAPPIMNFYPGECWSSWALRCPRSPVAGISLSILFRVAVQSDATQHNSIFVKLELC